MKLLSVIVLMFACSLHSLAQNTNTTLQFTPLVYDFAQINEVDGAVKCTFEYQNTGKTPFVIYDIATSCGCTTAKYDRSPLMPNQKRELTIIFDPVNQPGRVEKTILVRGNVENGSTMLKIKALVQPRPRTVEDDFPVTLSEGVRMQDLVMELGNQPQNKTTTHKLGVVNTSNKTAVVNIHQPNNIPPWAKAQIENPNLAPGQKTILNVTLNPQNNNLWGRKVFPVALTVNGRPQFTNIIVNTVLVEEFTADANVNPPKASFNNYFYHFSTLKKGVSADWQFKIRNAGQSVLYIRYLDHSTDVEVNADKPTLQPSQIATVTVKVQGQKVGSLNEIIRVITNDPLKPVQEIRVMANIVE